MTKEDEKKLSDVLDLAKIEIVNKPIAESHGLPNECYMSDDYAKIERKKLFEEKWSVIGVASSTPKPGDIRPFDLLDIPLIVLGDKKHNEITKEEIDKVIEDLREVLWKLLNIASNVVK